MNKYFVIEVITEKLKREIGMVAKPFPEELKLLELGLDDVAKDLWEEPAPSSGDVAKDILSPKKDK